ncbi:MAG: 2-amino-4-hydroxy-6-hydroxymethyldihydropteridine diphosphokinase [Paracoccus sp. (in: a-proteobacteria)]|nr:2-amino-4-hydroxy-6-hydroxymethyldihydropteridine diphosphokinase [Paracoccus sp. (in: a-proteobacteria)]
MQENLCFIATGANLSYSATGPAGSQIAALRALDQRADMAVVAVSRFYRSPAFPAGSGPDYVNACAAIRSGLGPQDLLAVLHETEAALGRVRAQRWGARVIDLDLIGLGAMVLPDAATQSHWRELPPPAQAETAPGQLILPHPRMQDRAFVLKPLADIAPLWRHPLTGLSVAAMLAALPAADRDAVLPFIS